MDFDRGVIIRDKTRLEQLIERFNSKAQAKFYLESHGDVFSHYEEEHATFYRSLDLVRNATKALLKFKIMDRSFLPTYIFGESELVIILGQDGLVANTAKYVASLPIVAINPDPERYDGVLLSFDPHQLSEILNNLFADNYQIKKVSMAEAQLADGQRLLAFNDFYIGASSHVSSRYNISFKGVSESQSSSGVLVATGAGSTGWLSSAFNMAYNLNRFASSNTELVNTYMDWSKDELMFVVREPFLSNVTQTGIGCGMITKGETLHIESKMTNNGVIFSDGIESDHIRFNMGSQVDIGLAKEKAHLVVA